jgi:hypothetical protein
VRVCARVCVCALVCVFSSTQPSMHSTAKGISIVICVHVVVSLYNQQQTENKNEAFLSQL